MLLFFKDCCLYSLKCLFIFDFSPLDINIKTAATVQQHHRTCMPSSCSSKHYLSFKFYTSEKAPIFSHSSFTLMEKPPFSLIQPMKKPPESSNVAASTSQQRAVQPQCIISGTSWTPSARASSSARRSSSGRPSSRLSTTLPSPGCLSAQA